MFPERPIEERKFASTDLYYRLGIPEFLVVYVGGLDDIAMRKK